MFGFNRGDVKTEGHCTVRNSDFYRSLGRWVGGWVGMWVGGWLVGWLVGWSVSGDRASPCFSPF
jgi:hypothetical protein